MSEFTVAFDSSKLELGEIDIVIMSRNLHVRKLSDEEQTEIVDTLIKILESNLSSTYEGKFHLEIVGIYDGCILAKIKIFWTIAGAIAAAIAGYPSEQKCSGMTLMVPL